MNSEPHRLVTGTELWLLRADAHRVHFDPAGKSFDEIARDHHGISDTCRELLAPDPAGTTSATHQAAANTAYAQTLLLNAGIGRQGGDLDFYVDPVQAGDPRGRIVSGCSTPEPAGEWESTAIPDATPGEVLQPHESPLTTARFWP